MSKHTPTPWKIKERAIGYLDIGVGVTTIVSADLGNTDPAYPEKEARANAAHIVKCVNMHEQLIAVLKEAYDFLSPFETMAKRIPLNDKIAHLLDEAEDDIGSISED